MIENEKLTADGEGWKQVALFHHRNEEYYRGLVVSIGKMLGPEAYTSDDGSVQDSVLCAKVPELVAKLVGKPLPDPATS